MTKNKEHRKYFFQKSDASDNKITQVLNNARQICNICWFSPKITALQLWPPKYF
jgi:hypothetical protein